MRLTKSIATALYYTGIDPFTKKEVHVAKGINDRKMKRVFMQFFEPSNYFEVREALLQADRADLLGGGCDCLIPAQPLKEAIEARGRRANERANGDPNPQRSCRAHPRHVSLVGACQQFPQFHRQRL